LTRPGDFAQTCHHGRRIVVNQHQIRRHTATIGGQNILRQLRQRVGAGRAQRLKVLPLLSAELRSNLLHYSGTVTSDHSPWRAILQGRRFVIFLCERSEAIHLCFEQPRKKMDCHAG